MNAKNWAWFSSYSVILWFDNVSSIFRFVFLTWFQRCQLFSVPTSSRWEWVLKRYQRPQRRSGARKYISDSYAWKKCSIQYEVLSRVLYSVNERSLQPERRVDRSARNVRTVVLSPFSMMPRAGNQRFSTECKRGAYSNFQGLVASHRRISDNSGAEIVDLNSMFE